MIPSRVDSHFQNQSTKIYLKEAMHGTHSTIVRNQPAIIISEGEVSINHPITIGMLIPTPILGEITTLTAGGAIKLHGLIITIIGEATTIQQPGTALAPMDGGILLLITHGGAIIMPGEVSR
jgi:hypothetical protein